MVESSPYKFLGVFGKFLGWYGLASGNFGRVDSVKTNTQSAVRKRHGRFLSTSRTQERNVTNPNGISIDYLLDDTENHLVLLEILFGDIVHGLKLYQYVSSDARLIFITGKTYLFGPHRLGLALVCSLFSKWRACQVSR